VSIDIFIKEILCITSSCWQIFLRTSSCSCLDSSICMWLQI